MMNRILVVGGTGLLGREVVFQLVERGAPFRALARRPEAAALPPHVEITPGDLTLPETMDRALQGIDTVFLVWTAPPGTIAPAIERIARQARRIVFVSAPLKTPHPFFQQPNPIRTMMEQIESVIESSRLRWTFLRPGMFAANALRFWAPQIRAGDVVRWPHLAAPTAPIDERDIAAVAVRALCEDGHDEAEYVLTGPESLTQFETISVIGQAIGRPLRIEEITPDEWRRDMSPTWPEVVLNMLLNAWAAGMGQPAHITSTFAEITGRAPRTFLEWANDHAAHFQR